MQYSDEELRHMKARRRELVEKYGDKGQHHPMGRLIGGLNPAAQELYLLRGKIAKAESERRGPSPVLTPRPGSGSGYGLKFDIEYQGRRGKLGTDNFGRWYVVVGEGSDADVIGRDFKTKGEAAKAFTRLSGSTVQHYARQRLEGVRGRRLPRQGGSTKSSCRFTVGTSAGADLVSFPVSRDGWKSAIAKAQTLAKENKDQRDINFSCGDSTPFGHNSLFLVTCSTGTKSTEYVDPNDPRNPLVCTTQYAQRPIRNQPSPVLAERRRALKRR